MVWSVWRVSSPTLVSHTLASHTLASHTSSFTFVHTLRATASITHLAQPHLIRQDPIQAVLVQRNHPLHARELVIAQLCATDQLGLTERVLLIGPGLCRVCRSVGIGVGVGIGIGSSLGFGLLCIRRTARRVLFSLLVSPYPPNPPQ